MQEHCRQRTLKYTMRPMLTIRPTIAAVMGNYGDIGGNQWRRSDEASSGPRLEDTAGKTCKAAMTECMLKASNYR